MKKTIKKGMVGALSLGLAFSVATPALAEEVESATEESTKSTAQVDSKTVKEDTQADASTEKDAAAEDATKEDADKATEEAAKKEETATDAKTEDKKADVKADADHSYTLNENVTYKVGETPDVNDFVTVTGGTADFSVVPSTRQVGTQTVYISIKYENPLSYVQVKTTMNVVPRAAAPVITPLPADQLVFEVGDYFLPEDLATATTTLDNDYILMTFADGKGPDTDTVGVHTSTVVAKDADGNTSTREISYTVCNFDLKTPYVNTYRSTNTDIYGSADPNVTIVMTDEDGNDVMSVKSDANGDFHFHLSQPLELGDKFGIYAQNGDYEFSNYIQYYTYSKIDNNGSTGTDETNGISGNDAANTNSNPNVAENVSTDAAAKNTAANTNVTSTAKSTAKTLPKTGDKSSLPLGLAGLVLAGSAAVVLRKSVK
ncbi:LPXTG cell wall anchor domain-containing protein [Listeria costaricensis]|uniref:LPXTG cell wall anchor domain-containing protein n=1 Tax=Listeria costaricensis TaxID=2026604 RepID=UPI000C08D18F|nr:LPXTG cell wall anchor domain-containing protein [Listeria costaricensis]